MKNDFKVYFIILIISVILLFLEVFILKLSGVIGLLLCLICVYFIVGVIIKFVFLLHIFNDDVMKMLDILFFI